MWFTSLTPPTQTIAPLTAVSNAVEESTRAVQTFSTQRKYRRTSFVLIRTITTGVAGQIAFTGSGQTYSWTAPAGVTGVSVVAIGGGGAGHDGWANPAGSGGGLGWKNGIAVTPGSAYTVVVGAGGLSYPNTTGSPNLMLGGNSYFIDTATVAGYGGGNPGYSSTGGPNANGHGGGWVGEGGGAGGNAGSYQGGGGAGGYTGRGGNNNETAGPYQIAGGGAGGGGYHSSTHGSGAGGGSGFLGATGHNSPGNAFYNPFTGYNNSSSYGSGGAGSHGGANGHYGENPFGGPGQSSNNIQGGNYGGGGGGPGSSWPSSSGNGGQGAVRIMWSGGTFLTTNDNDTETLVTTGVGSGSVVRSYPQTGVADV